MECPQTFVIPQQAIDDGKRLGLTGGIEAQILEMARRSAIVTYPGVNRRFNDFSMNIQDQVVLSLTSGGTVMPAMVAGAGNHRELTLKVAI